MVSERTLAEPPIVAIVGPTATGKTAVGALLARALGGEIISADSMAVYRGMDIGTAKPGPDLRASVAFHLVDVVDPDEEFNVARFKALAESALTGIRARGSRPLLVGGTGLYVRALLDGFGLTGTGADPALRARLEGEADACGASELHRRLSEVDPQAAARVHPNDRVRIVRALEVFYATGEAISAQQARDARTRQQLPSTRFGLTAPREALNARIDARVDAMMAAGLVDEVQRLHARGFGRGLAPLESVGYKEVGAYLAGEIGLRDAVDAIKRNTRRLAKRQMTWFRSDAEIVWIDAGSLAPADAAEAVLARLTV